jgi:3D (Asp-Asp-Asp) domain-containing protein
VKPAVTAYLLFQLATSWYDSNKDYLTSEFARLESQATAQRKQSLSARFGVRPVIMIATAYEPSAISCGYWARFHRTRTGMRPRRGVVAVDPRVIPFHTKMYIEGYGYGWAEDTGSAIKGNRIDVFFNSYWNARKWGRKKVQVYILKVGRG